MSRKVYFIQVVLILVCVCCSLTAQQAPKIAKIEFQGLKRYSPDEMSSTAGLKIGDTFEVAALDAAAQRLADTGYFKNVSYQTKSDHDQITITFQVEEVPVAKSQVIFDNFIWYSDADLIAAVQRDIPSFDGTAPDNGDVVQRITKSLERFLHENKIDAEVNYLTSQDSPNSPVQEHVFSVVGVPMPICTLHFPGANTIDEANLTAASHPLIGTDYSRKFVSLFTLNNLIPKYHALGQLKAEFSPPLAKAEASSTCKSGVDVSLPVAEGEVYKWDHAEWAGNTALSAQELNSVLEMKAGEPANGLKLDKLSKVIGQAYGRKGYLVTRVKTHPEFNDVARKVVYRIDVVEGPQFRMGKLIAKGLSTEANKSLDEHWRLKAGDVFDQDYLQQFSKKEMEEALRNTYLERRSQGKPAPSVKVSTNMNRETLTVDVTFELTN